MADRDRIKGKAKEATGTVQQKAGRITGNKEMEARGEERKQEGKAQDLWGKTKDLARDAKDTVADRIPDGDDR